MSAARSGTGAEMTAWTPHGGARAGPRAAAGALLCILGLVLPGPALCAPPTDAARAALSLGRHHYDRGDYDKAARLFHDAWSIDHRPIALYNAARAEQRGFALEAAKRDYEKLLALPDLPAKVAAKARLHLRETREALAHLAQAKAAPSPPSAVRAEPDEGLGWPAWSALGGAGVLAAGAGLIYALARADEAELQGAVEDAGPDHVVRGVTAVEARDRAEAIAGRKTLAAGLVSGAVLLAGAGAWLAWRAPAGDEAALRLRVMPRGVRVSLRF